MWVLRPVVIRMSTFSERVGLKIPSTVVQVNSVSEELRTTLWNALDLHFWSKDGYVYREYGGGGDIEPFARSLWMNFFKQPMDSLPVLGSDVLKLIRSYFFKCSWNEVYDFLEFTCRYYVKNFPRLPVVFNTYLEREKSGYRFVGTQLVNIVNMEELTALQEGTNDDRFSPVSSHLKRAVELYADRKNPDYRNSIKESISAVESMAKIITSNDKATLVEALRVLEKGAKLHTALKDGFIKLYAYTSDEDGIRHAMLQEPNLSEADARYFLLSCTSFVNYLKSQMQA